MQIAKEDLEDFKKRYAKAFKKKLSDAEASEMANNLAELYVFLSKPLPSEQREGPTPPKEALPGAPSPK